MKEERVRRRKNRRKRKGKEQESEEKKEKKKGRKATIGAVCLCASAEDVSGSSPPHPPSSWSQP